MSAAALGPMYPARRLGIDPRAYDPDNVLSNPLLDAVLPRA